MAGNQFCIHRAMARDSHLKAVLAAWGNDGKMVEKVNAAKLLVVGAGGIGCELLKVRPPERGRKDEWGEGYG